MHNSTSCSCHVKKWHIYKKLYAVAEEKDAFVTSVLQQTEQEMQVKVP